MHRWLLERNPRLYGVSYAIDQLGDIYLAGRLPLSRRHPATRSTGCSARSWRTRTAPSTRLLELGFASAIRREYAWRSLARRITRNLDAFTHLTRRDAGASAVSGAGAGADAVSGTDADAGGGQG